jgi:hypothetical protein
MLRLTPRHRLQSLLILLAFSGSIPIYAAVNVTQRSYDPNRTGANTTETLLTPANVSSTANQFHKQFVMRVDGKIEGSPLYASSVQIAGGTHNVIYVGTMHNTVFAFDADTGAQLSARWLGNPVTGFDLHTLKPATIHTEWGILSTPVIDLTTGTLYVVRWGYENGTSGPTYRLFGLDMTNLSNDKFNSVMLDSFHVNGGGFNRYLQVQRSGLALAAKPGGPQAVVVAFSGGEGGGAPGWVIAYDTAKLAQNTPEADVWCSNPPNNNGPGGGGGIWMANAAPAIDQNGDIYVVTGNGPYSPQFGLDQLGESIVHLTWNPGSPGTLTLSDWFTPFNDAGRDGGHKDQDLGSGGIIALPDEMGLIAGGKDGVYYHVNRANMGKTDYTQLIDSPFVASFDYQPTNGHTSLFDDLNQVTSTDPFTIGAATSGRTAHIHGAGVYFNNQLFVNGENNKVRVFTKTGGHFAAQPTARGTSTASWGSGSPGGMAGGILALSANGTSSAILWSNEAFGNLPSDPDANQAPTPDILRAYDVSTAASGTLQSIWDSEVEPNDHVGASTKFAPPLVANGKVYQATYDNQVVVYGLGSASKTPTRDIRRTVVFLYAQTIPGQNVYLRGGNGNGGNQPETPIRIRHRNWLNAATNVYRWGDVNLDWGVAELGQATPPGKFGGGSPMEWTTSLAQGSGQPYVTMAGYGIADQNNFGANYWMLDVDMDCEQAFDDGKGNKWFELQALIAPRPGPESSTGEPPITQTSNPMPPYSSPNHMGLCGMVNVFVGNFGNQPANLNPNSAQFFTPAYTYLSPVDDRSASNDVLMNTPCVAPATETRCVGNILQTCQAVNGGNFFRSLQNCNLSSAGGNFGQMCQNSKGVCCTPNPTTGDICQ